MSRLLPLWSAQNRAAIYATAWGPASISPMDIVQLWSYFVWMDSRPHSHHHLDGPLSFKQGNRYYLSYLNVSSLKEKTHRYIVYEVKSHVIFFHRWCLWKVIHTSSNLLVGTSQSWVSSSHWADTLRNTSSSTICPQVDRLRQLSDNPRPKDAIFLKCDT